MENFTDNRFHFLLCGGGRINTIGGVIRFYSDLSNYLCDRGYKVTIVANAKASDVPFYEYHPDVNLIHVKYPHSMKQAWQYRVVVELLDPDVVVMTFSNRIGLAAMVGLYNMSVPVLRSEHGNPDHIVETIWKGCADERAASFLGGDRIHLLSEEFKVRQSFPASIQDRMFIASSPVPKAKKHAQPHVRKNGRYTVMYSGRLEEYEKNSMLLLEAFLLLWEQFTDWDLDLFGDGGLRHTMENMARRAGALGQRVRFHGSIPIDQLCDRYAQSHLFVLPSDTEGAPIALGEALAHGVPSIGFADCAGTNERIINEFNGILVDASSNNRGQRIEALASAMACLMKDERMREKMGRKAIESVERYTPERIFAIWEDELVSLAQKKADIASKRKKIYANLQPDEVRLRKIVLDYTSLIRMKKSDLVAFRRKIKMQSKYWNENVNINVCESFLRRLKNRVGRYMSNKIE